MAIKAVGFDLFGTLVDAEADWEDCVRSMCGHLRDRGYEFSDDDFISCYRAAAVEHRKARREELREVNNRVWVADALSRMSFEVEASSPHVVSAVERYFSPWRLTVAPDAHEVLERLHGKFKIALVSNFTDSAYLHRCLEALGLEEFFDGVIVSDSVGWRKPHPAIFETFLELTGATADEAIFIGDDPVSDIKGAKNLGIKAVLLAKPGHAGSQEGETEVRPDHVVSSLTEFGEMLLADSI
ncbi:hypothetical protein AC482_02515 [miscellaneous Crenarchaeota group-15 archaeon DG-45]|uniref:HAD family hydrolase n=1 Tax=miscellaneous Crenarchaeota group-15 archaeon DG-45 TaxID=1685127 RepID=A0A0M0BQS7_9ARCH|nr:MAG: hypothetical protein AC482_02515 [miscellaneous Crenarchaeota group-15 archaeon DG-45]